MLFDPKGIKLLFQYSRFYIILKKDEIQYKTGLNVDNRIYFLVEDEIDRWVHYTPDIVWIREVHFPIDAKIYMEDDGSLCADKIILGERQPIEDFYDRFTENELMDKIRNYIRIFKYIKKQTTKLCLYACKKDGRMLEYVKNKTTEICEVAIKNNSLALKFVEDQTFELCLLAMKNWEIPIFANDEFKLMLSNYIKESCRKDDGFMYD